ncbi:MAG: hypothetical protein DRI46_14480 [Chloroflexi bacterium]|nr:MAG: hypothetical protein DRI46_14480 [Chloroflexota bacterium]
MKHIKDPGQKQLFDPFERLFSPLATKTIQDGWQGLFREVILELMPAQIIAGKFNPSNGRPTKELYSVAGLIFISEFMDWTTEQAAQAYMFRTDIWYTLNLKPGAQSMSTRTIERYRKIFRESELASKVMSDVTNSLVGLLELSVTEQRLDSTHVFSNMATFGRTRLMGVTIKRFLTQLKRHGRNIFDTLPEELRERYGKSQNQLFADKSKDSKSLKLLRQQVAEDMYFLIERFSDEDRFSNRSTFRDLCTVFAQQCEITEEKVELRKETGGNVTQNPSDPDATYDGHKGPGYQVQLSETCSKDNKVQLITSAIPQTACEQDTDAVEKVRDDLRESDNLPEQMLADTSYGSDENVQSSLEKGGMNLVSPVSGKEPKSEISICDFEIDEETNTVKVCPAGHKPFKSEYNSEKDITRTIMAISVCSSCEKRKECPIERKRNNCRFEFTTKELRLAKRRRFEKTDEFKAKYRKRSGIEATNSGIKRRTGMGKLRVRGRPAVFNAILLKVAGWNILQAARSMKIREYVRKRVPWNSDDKVSAMIESCSCAIRAQIRSSWKHIHLRMRNTHWIGKYQLQLVT